MTQEPTASSAEDTQPDSVTINIKSTNAKHTLSVPLSITAIELKDRLSTPDYAGVPASSQRLIYSGRVLKDGDTLESHKVKNGNTIHLVKSAPSNQRQNPASQSSGDATTDSTSGSNVPRPTGVPSNIAAGTGNNPLAGLTGARYAGFAQLPGAGMFGPDGGMGPPPSQDQMIEMLSNPAFSQMMNEALQNPAMIDMMIQQNPQLREMGPAGRQFLQSEQFRRMVTDPQSLRAMGQLQAAMGMGPFGGPGGGGGGQEAFPAPGVTTTTPAENRGEAGSNHAQNDASTDPTGPAGQANNPFAALLGMAPSSTNQPSTNPTASQQPANPFAALFGNPPPSNSDPQQQQQQPATQQDTIPPAANPFLNIQNNPLFQHPELMNQFVQAMGGGGTATGPGTAAASPFGGNTGSNPLANLGALFGPGGMGGLGGMGMGGAGGGGMGMGGAAADNRPPEERFATQLRQLNEMGFFDFERNVRALMRSGGDVGGALEDLFGGS